MTDGRPSPGDIERAASDLIKRHGRVASAWAAERVAQFERAGDWLAHAAALRLLTAVELQLADES